MEVETGVECPICYEKISDDDMEELSCGHKFHYSCILSTFRAAPINYDNKVRECPYCREQSDFLMLRPGTLPLKNIHKEYEQLKGKNIKVESLDKYLIQCQCKAILKTGANKGNQCSKKIHEGSYCKIHSKKPVATYMYFSV